MKILTLLLGTLLYGGTLTAEVPLEYHVSVAAQASSKSLSPYMLGSWNQGKYMEGNGIWQEASALKSLDMNKRFDWSAGIGYLVGIGSKTNYDRYDAASQTWGTNADRRNAFRMTQIFGELKYRAVFLTLGMKPSKSRLLDERLSSGDVTRSNNATPVPGIAAGFLDFVDIPLTNGWVQIDGEIMYGKMMDSKFKKREFNYFDGVISENVWYNYKRCYFRTNPSKNFHVTIGMQAAGMFGGSTSKYMEGRVIRTDSRGFRLGDVLQMFIPRPGGEYYYTGSHLGSWDFKADYRFRDGGQLSAYFEWPWEDGSGIGRQNGWDGLWGLRYALPRKGIVSKAVVEYLDFTNQSGPIHYDPEDNPYNPLTGLARGADNYYNNDFYGAYTNYGMGIGTPFLMAPIYNRNGCIEYLHNRARGFHAAIEGNPADWIDYRLMAGYQKAGGAGQKPAFRRLSSTSAMLDVTARPFRCMPAMELGLDVAFDKGELRGDNFGVRFKIAYNGLWNIKKIRK